MNRSAFVVSFAIATPISQALEPSAPGISPLSTECRSVVMVNCRERGEFANPRGVSIDTWTQLQNRRLGSDAWLLDEVVIEGERLRRPGVGEMLERSLSGPTWPSQFATSDLGNGVRCTRALLLGYQECTRLMNRVGKALDGPWR